MCPTSFLATDTRLYVLIIRPFSRNLINVNALYKMYLLMYRIALHGSTIGKTKSRSYDEVVTMLKSVCSMHVIIQLYCVNYPGMPIIYVCVHVRTYVFIINNLDFEQ